MSELLDRVLELRARFALASSPRQLADCMADLSALERTVQAQAAQLQTMRQDIDDAERARDGANLARMRVSGQLQTLYKSLAAATPDFQSEDGDLQHAALRRVEWLTSHAGFDPQAAAAARESELEAPMPSRVVLEAVSRGERRFTKPQLEFSVSEAIVLTGWEMTPVEILAKGEPWLAELILSNHAAPPD